MSAIDRLSNPLPCSETVRVTQRYGCLAVHGDDTAQGLTPDSGPCRPFSQEWVLRVLTAYAMVQELRLADDGTRKNAVIKFFPATGG